MFRKTFDSPLDVMVYLNSGGEMINSIGIRIKKNGDTIECSSENGYTWHMNLSDCMILYRAYHYYVEEDTRQRFNSPYEVKDHLQSGAVMYTFNSIKIKMVGLKVKCSVEGGYEWEIKLMECMSLFNDYFYIQIQDL